MNQLSTKVVEIKLSMNQQSTKTAEIKFQSIRHRPRLSRSNFSEIDINKGVSDQILVNQLLTNVVEIKLSVN